MEQKNRFIVGTMCFTYNHVSYIVDTMDSLTMQETTFPVVSVIVDDGSTDGEPEIIKGYLTEHFQEPYRTEETDDYRLICANHKTNPNCQFVVFLLKYNHYSIKKNKSPYPAEWLDKVKYQAFCEGDDFWTDPLKLQKQVDLLESHPDYSMCFHNAISHWDKGGREDALFSDIQDRPYSGREIFEKWIVPTASVTLRREVLQSDIYIKAFHNKKFCYGDIILFLSCAACGKVYGMSDVMSVYRRHEGSFVFSYDVNKQIRQAYHSLEIYKVFGNEYRKLSIDKFFKNGMEAFLNAKAEGEIHYKLLCDLVRYAPKRTFSAFWVMLKKKVRR